MTAYLRIRRALGYQLLRHERLLTDFAAHLDRLGQDWITVDAALAWATAPPRVSRRDAARRLSVVRRFAGYVAVFDPATEVPPPTSLLGDCTTRIPPYIFTRPEVTALMAAARRLSPPLAAAGYATLIGLMAATGLRTGEARGVVKLGLWRRSRPVAGSTWSGKHCGLSEALSRVTMTVGD